MIYGLFLRTVLLWHSTWFINSAAHMRGYRTFNTPDNSPNLWWAAIFAYGEGWHNNHHAHPHVAQAGWKWWSIQILKQLGLGRKVVMPSTV